MSPKGCDTTDSDLKGHLAAEAIAACRAARCRWLLYCSVVRVTPRLADRRGPFHQRGRGEVARRNGPVPCFPILLMSSFVASSEHLSKQAVPFLTRGPGDNPTGSLTQAKQTPSAPPPRPGPHPPTPAGQNPARAVVPLNRVRTGGSRGASVPAPLGPVYPAGSAPGAPSWPYCSRVVIGVCTPCPVAPPCGAVPVNGLYAQPRHESCG